MHFNPQRKVGISLLNGGKVGGEVLMGICIGPVEGGRFTGGGREAAIVLGDAQSQPPFCEVVMNVLVVQS